MKRTYLVKYSFRTCHADAGSQSWAEVATDQEISGVIDLRIWEHKIQEQRGDKASIFIEDFKLVSQD